MGNRIVGQLIGGSAQGFRRRQQGQNRPLVQRFESHEHVELGEKSAGGPSGFIILEAHRRDLPDRTNPPEKWPATWRDLYNRGNADQKRMLKQGLTHGEIVALAGDMYAGLGAGNVTDVGKTYDRLNKASLRELYDLIPLMRGEASTAKLEEATGGRYMTLAKKNLSHFSNVTGGRDNATVWRRGHAAAINAARNGDANTAWAMEAIAEHFLTDAFSGGHTREDREPLLASNQGQVEAKVQHDLDNIHGVEVANRRGDKWIAYGDEHLNDRANARNRELALEAVRLSKQDIADALAGKQAYPEAPASPPEGMFSAEQVIPRPVDPSKSRWSGSDKARHLKDLAGKELPEQLTPNDTRIRDWVSRQPTSALAQVPVDEKTRMTSRLLDGWVSDEDIVAIEKLYRNTPSDAERKSLAGAISSRVKDLNNMGQRARLRLLIGG